MQDKSWTDTLSEDDVKFFQDVEVMSGNLITQVYVFIDLFHQYIDLIQSSAIFSPEFIEPESQDANVYPTQTPANRAERRARKTPFETVQK